MKEIEEIRSYCLNCKNSQCRIKDSPIDNCILAFIHEIDSKKAYEILCNTTVLPAICGRICPHEKERDGSCIRGIKGEAVSIGAMEAYIGDLSIENNYELSIEVDERAKDKRVAVIGSGPAGLTCAAFLARRGVKVTIYEKHDKLGGLLTHGIPDFRLPREVVEKTIEKILDLGVETKLNQELGRDFEIEDLAKKYDAVFVAIGANIPAKMNVEGEGLEGVYGGNYLLEYNKHPNYTGKKVAIIGGGNVAIDVARTSTRVGDYNVSMFCLEDRANMPASEEEIEEAVEEGVKLDCGWGPKEILTENGKVTGIVLKRCTSVKDADGRFNPQYDENDTKTVKCSHVFLSIGQTTIWGDLLKGTKVEIDGVRVKADKLTYQTTDPDVFIGGDVYTGPRFAIDAIAAGKEAAISIHRYVQPHSSLTIGRNRRDFIELDKNNIKVESYDNSSRQIPGTDNSFDHKKSFRDAKLTFTEEQVKAETARCLGCGASVVDPNKCIGCGICTTKCEFDAIHLNRDLPECSTMRKSEDKLKYILPYGAKQAIKIKFRKK